MTTIGSLCALDSGCSLENEDANIDVIRLFRRKGNSVLGRWLQNRSLKFKILLTDRRATIRSLHVLKVVYFLHKKKRA
jgi:hypothetical protein